MHHNNSHRSLKSPPPPSSHSITSNHPRKTSQQRGIDPSTDLLTLIPPKENQKKPPSKRNHNHLGAPSGTGSLPGGKRRASGDSVNGEGEVESPDEDSGSSTAEDDADDENDEEDDQPAVEGPARVNRKRKYSSTDTDKDSLSVYCESPLTPSKANTENDAVSRNGTSESNIHLAGRSTKARSYSIASTNTIQSSVTGMNDSDDAAITETDEEPDYPRKRVARHLSPSGQLSIDETSVSIVHTESNGYDGPHATDSNVSIGPFDDMESDSASSIDDDQIIQVEEMQLELEFELEGPDFDAAGFLPTFPNPFDDHAIYDDVDLASELVRHEELVVNNHSFGNGSADWRTLADFYNFESTLQEDLFSVPVSRDDTPAGSPLNGAHQNMVTVDDFDFHSEGWSEDDGLIDADIHNPFFEQTDPAVQHLVKSQQPWDPQWADDSNEEDFWKHVLTSGESSGEGGDGHDEDETGEGGECGNESNDDDDGFDCK